VSPKRLARRLVQVAVPGLFLTLAACGGNMEDPTAKANPNARIRYELTVRTDTAVDRFDSIRGSVDYRVDNESCVPAAPITGAHDVPTKHVPIKLRPVGNDTLVGTMETDLLLDEDYFGLGVCHWTFVAVNVDFNIGKGKLYTSLVLRDLESGIQISRAYPNRVFELRGTEFAIPGSVLDGRSVQPDGTFGILVKARRVAQ
jgi:hypothetical protein